ncbi:uncharacterized protein F4812DRAFT_454466 [Daldinia caldariorum]|uniref:uncharacterized protein n=1 Tax=Daldinia caldariorum TaxID=326644 RepID=UPI00200889B0|nr:uncharacterized protein F4812DRAFT_454466 [Daldinia caldariorum]KAI1472651.1 hypothetical protein F4812DRAFT_454466 [Daldinia caldariorum]
MASMSINAVPHVYMPILDFVRAEFIINIVVGVLVLITVGLRVLGRINGPGLGADDYLVIFATPLGIAMLVCQGLFAPVGNGYNLAEHPELALNISFILQLTFCMQIIYVTLLATVKASMLFFFLRVFTTPFMRKAAMICLAFVGAWMISYLCACIFICTPVHAQWTGLGQCGAYIHMIQSLIITNAIGDIVIMALPMKIIWGLQTRTTDKIGITSCFALGIACVICAIFRVIYISTVDLNSNITGTMPTTVFLFSLEPNVAILCVSIPMLRPFWVRYRERTRGASKLREYSDEQTIGSKGMKNSGQRSKNANTLTDTMNMTTWEMDDYNNQETNKFDGAGQTYADESGSEKNLTASPQQPGKNGIAVETKWTVTRN